jgi:phage tail-like protein
VVRLDTGGVVGAIDGFRGPVAALAIDLDGRVYIKPGADGRHLVAEPDAARVRRGTMTTAVLDAGRERAWSRAVVEVTPTATSAVILEVAGDAPGAAPSWVRATTLDHRLSESRYLSMRATITVGRDGSSPSVHQLRAQTQGDSYYDYLPAVYSRPSNRSALLDGLLDLAKSEFDDLEGSIQSLPRTLSSSTAAVGDLRRLAAWLGLPTPTLRADEDERSVLTALLAEVPTLYETRGTREGLRRLIETYARVRPAIFEDHVNRPVWALGTTTSALGFGTALPATSIDGYVVDESTIGLSGPEAAATWGRALFAAAAHRFTVAIPAAAAATDETRQLVAATIDREKPAHTSCHVCYVRPRLLVGVQARVGLDAIVGEPSEMVLEERSRLDLDTRAAGDDTVSTIERRAHLGADTRLS